MFTSEGAKEWLEQYKSPNELAHYGVLGMRWGRRKRASIERDEREEREEAKRKPPSREQVVNGVIAAAGLAYAGYKSYQLLQAFKPELFVMAYNAGTKINTRRGAQAVMDVSRHIGNTPIVNLVKGADGVFRLAT